MERRKFTREFKLEAVRLIKERGVWVAQASRDLDVHQTVLRNWVRDFGGDALLHHSDQGSQYTSEQFRGCQIVCVSGDRVPF